MKKNAILVMLAFTVLCLQGCTKGKDCLCEKFSKATGEYEGSKFTDDFETCTGASFVLSNEDPYFYYDCYDLYQ